MEARRLVTRDRMECQMLWTGSGNGQRLQRTSCQSRGGKGKGKTPPPAASKEPHAAANCRMTQPRRSLRVGASGGGVGSVVGAPVGASVWVGAAVTVGAPVGAYVSVVGA